MGKPSGAMYTATDTPKIKVVLVGDSYVGKTSLANVFVNGFFKEAYTTSVTGHYMAKTLENPKVTMQLWDTAGQERFRSMLPAFMRGALCALIVYDISIRESFRSVRDYWISYVEETASQNLVKVLVGNKMDLNVRAVKTSEGRTLARLHDMFFAETSAKLKINVDEMFIDAALFVVSTIPKSVERATGIRLEEPVQPKQSRCCISSRWKQ